MTSTRGNPRLGQTGTSLTSLGAVGGPRGTAAGALRVIVEFVTQYDPEAIKALESDLTQLTALEDKLGNDQIKIADKVSKARIKIAQAEAVIQAKILRDPKTGRQSARDLRQAEALREVGTRTAIRQAVQLEQAAIKRSNLTDKERRIVNDLVAARTRLRNLEAQALRISQDRLAVDEQQRAVQSQLTGFQQLKAGLPGRIGGLALGALGGLVGGAIIGVGFTAAQVALEAVGEAALNFLDPARKAREALEDVGGAILELRDASEGMSTEQAAVQFLRELGVEADAATARLLATAAAAQEDKQVLDAYTTAQEVARNAEALRQAQVERLSGMLAEQDAAQGKLVTTTSHAGTVAREVADSAYYEAAAIELLALWHSNATAEAKKQIEAQAALQRHLEATAILARFAADALQQTITAGAATAFTNPLESQIQALQDTGPSAKTQALEAQIEKLQSQGSGGGGASKSREQANIAEERALILLRMRLRELGTAINLEEYEGKFLLEAINAKIKALEKQKAAQDRLNRSLDLQFRMSQVLRRQEGESISDFLERRAQENRNLLAEQRDLEFERIRESLQEQQEKVQDEVALAELAERGKTAAAVSGTSNRLKQLQKELEASRKADREAVAAKLKALQEQKEAYEKNAANAAYYASIAANEEIRQAARAANTVSKIAALSGQTRGLQAAKSFLTALLQSGVLKPSEASQIQAAIDRINKTLSSIGQAQYDVMKNTLVKPGQAPQPFAKGGIIPLLNSSTAGRNARFGEEGTEGAALILTNQAINKMKQSMGEQPFGDIIIESHGDPMRDAYIFKQRVKEIVREELNG